MKILIATIFFALLSCNEHHDSLQMKLHKLDQNKVDVKSDQISTTLLDGLTYQKSVWKKKNDFHVLERYNQFELNKCQECHDSKNSIPKIA